MEEKGAAGFTKNHVAETTGVSVGSLYQYYPNKGALLLAVHEREAASLWSALDQVLRDTERTPRERLFTVVHLAFEVQYGAQQLHHALDYAGVAAAEARSFTELLAEMTERLAAFLREVHPEREDEHDELASYVVEVLTALLERLPRQSLDADRLRLLAERTGVMLSELLGL